MAIFRPRRSAKWTYLLRFAGPPSDGSLPENISASLFYVFSADRYAHLNSVSVDVSSGPAFARYDDVNEVSIRMTRPLSQELTVYMEYDYNQDRSNLAVYRDEQQVVVGGLTWRL